MSLGESSEAQEDEALIQLREDDLDDAFALEADQKTGKKFMSIILTNLHVNYEGWRAELPQEEETKEGGEGEKKALEDGTAGEEEKEGEVADDETVSTLHEGRGSCLRSCSCDVYTLVLSHYHHNIIHMCYNHASC